VDVKTRRLLYVWGYFPDSAWQRCSLEPPEMERASLLIESPLPQLSRGVAVQYNAASSWFVAYDELGGWLYFGDGNHGQRTILFATGTAVSSAEDKILGLWLRPLVV